MEKYQIGTDAKIQDHIKTVLDPGYCEKMPKTRGCSGAMKSNNLVFHPTKLGFALIKGYKELNQEENISYPILREEMESELALVAQNMKSRDDCIKSHVEIFNKLYIDAVAPWESFGAFWIDTLRQPWDFSCRYFKRRC